MRERGAGALGGATCQQPAAPEPRPPSRAPPLTPWPPPPSPAGLGQFISGAILFEETLYQDTRKGTSMVAELNKNGIIPGIKVDKGLHPLSNAPGESWCAGLDGLDQRCADYYKQGARFCKWRSTVSIPAGPSNIAVTDCAYGLARYAAIAQNAGLVPIVEPEILLDGDHDIDRTLEVAERTWAEVRRAGRVWGAAGLGRRLSAWLWRAAPLAQLHPPLTCPLPCSPLPTTTDLQVPGRQQRAV